MTIIVRLFARYREAAGVPAIEIEARSGSTLAQVWEGVRERVPALRSEERPLLACDHEYADPGRIVTGVEEIAAFPPVSGG